MVYAYTFALSNTISYNKIEPFPLIKRKKNNILCVFWRYSHPNHQDKRISQSISNNLFLLRLREGHLLMSLHVKQWTPRLGSALIMWTTRDSGLHGLFPSCVISTQHLLHPLPWPANVPGDPTVTPPPSLNYPLCSYFSVRWGRWRVSTALSAVGIASTEADGMFYLPKLVLIICTVKRQMVHAPWCSLCMLCKGACSPAYLPLLHLFLPLTGAYGAASLLPLQSMYFSLCRDWL